MARVSYTVKRYRFSSPALAQDGQGAYLPLDTINYWREDAAHRALYAAIERAYTQQVQGHVHPVLLDSEYINAKRSRR